MATSAEFRAQMDAIMGDYKPTYVDSCMITVEGKLMTMNEVLRTHTRHLAPKKKQEAARILLAWQEAGYPRIKGPYEVHFHFVSSTRTDPSNLLGWAQKSCLDALQIAHYGHGVIEEDDWKHHIADSSTYAYDQSKPKVDYIEITFTAVDLGV